MDLSIVIPRLPSDFVSRVSTYHSPYSPLKYKKTFPSVPKKEIKNNLFNWGEYDIYDLYDNVEESLITFENSFYKPYFSYNSRILVKTEIENNMKKLYLIIKDKNSWLRSTIFININDNEGEFYDYKYKNMF